MPALEELDATWREEGVHSVFVYTREAHPGEAMPTHESFDHKLAAARAMVQALSMKRRVWVDGLAGAVHQAWGSLPNMAFVVSAGGFVSYKANWTDASHLDLVVRRMLEEAEPVAEGQRRVPFLAEWAPRRLRDDDGFMEGLLRAGPRAVEEYVAAFESALGAATARPYREWWDKRRGS